MIKTVKLDKDIIFDNCQDINDFLRIDNKIYSAKEIFSDSQFCMGGILKFIGLELSAFDNVIVISDNPFLGDNLTLVLPVVKWLSELEYFNSITVLSQSWNVFKKDCDPVYFSDLNEQSSNLFDKNNIANTLVLCFSPAKSILIDEFITLGYTVLKSLNDSKLLICNFNNTPEYIVELNYLKDFLFTQDYIEGIRSQVIKDFNKNEIITDHSIELIDMVKSYCIRADLNLKGIDKWDKIFNLHQLDKEVSFYENVYEYDYVMFYLLFGRSFYFSNFSSFLNILHPKTFLDRPYIFINLNVGSSASNMKKSKGGLLDCLKFWLSNHTYSNNNVLLFNYPEYDAEFNVEIIDLINEYSTKFKNNIQILSSIDKPFWMYYIKSAYKVLSFDTGFVHLSYVLSDNVLSIGGQSFFWHYPGQNYVLMNYYDSEGEFILNKFHQSMNEIVDWLKK